MALQSSGAISMVDIRTELNLSGAVSLGQTEFRNLAGVASGAISMSNFYGKANVQEVIFDNAGAGWNMA